VNLFESILLGIVQGATEFLPVSSSGHLVVGQRLLGLDLPGVAFEIAVHVGTLASIVWVYRTRVTRLLRGAVGRTRGAWSEIGLLALATLPAAIVGVGFDDQIERVFDTPAWAGVGFLVTAAILWSTRTPLGRGRSLSVTPRIALLIGCAQALALVPGISRSGTTVAAALWLGVAPLEAAAFSFMMALVAIGGAAVLAAPDLAAGTSGVGAGTVVAGAVAAGITGIAAIHTFVALLRRQDFHRFALYLVPLGVGFLLYLNSVPS
jgi:undecaprenyl-diphosphatase